MAGWLVSSGSVLVSYLLGSIPVGLMLARFKGIDIRKVGSGNIGATNVFRFVGKAWGVATFVGDALKGLIPASLFPLLAAKLLDGPPAPTLGLLCGCAAIAGHNWPVFLRFRGGKGVATSAGVLLGITPAAVGVGLVCWVILFATTRYVSVASIGAAIVVPATAWVVYADQGLLLPVTLSVLGAIVIWRHRSNMRRLLDGTEHRFQFKRKPTKNTNNHER